MQAYLSYRRSRRRRLWLLLLLLPLLVAVILFSGLIKGDPAAFWRQLQIADALPHLIVWEIRLPRLLGALLAGAGLGLSGLVLQVVLKNSLAAPTTLGIAQGAAFGAALAITLLGGGGAAIGTVPLPAWTGQADLIAVSAFIFSLLTTLVVVALGRLRRAGSEAIILAGVALSSLFMAGTTFLQYFADDTRLAMIVHWTFGDLGRGSWPELLRLTLVVIPAAAYFFSRRFSYNVLAAGEEVAFSLGVNVTRLRFVSMMVAALATALIVAYYGILGFVGLVAPHMSRRLVGADNSLLLPLSMIMGSLVLLAADLFGHAILDPVVLPAGVVTSFLGTPVFLLLLFGGGRLGERS